MSRRKVEDNEEKPNVPTHEEVESPRFIRRLIESGLGVLVSTNEDGERTAIRPLTLPKEIINILVGQIDRSKSEIVSLFGREFKRFLEATDLSEEVVKALSQLTVEVKAEISFKSPPGDEGKKTRLSLTTRKKGKEK